MEEKKLDLNEELSSDELRKDRRFVEEEIKKARVQMLLKREMSFFGNLAVRLLLKDGSRWTDTCSTNGKDLYYNREFFKTLDKEERIFVIGHQVLHCVFDHVYQSRYKDRDRKLWDAACDYVVNCALIEGKVGSPPAPEKLGTTAEELKEHNQRYAVLYDEKYIGWYAEEVYRDLKDQAGDDEDQDECEACEDNKLNGQVQFDTHLTGEEETDEENDGDGTDGPEYMTPEELEKARDQFRKAMIDAAKSGGGAGNLPASINRMVKDLTEPKLNWRELLNAEIQSALKSDFTFKRPSRKSRSTSFYLPDMENDFRVDVDVAIDVSGSITEQMLRDFLGEVKGIMEQFADFELRVMCFDTVCHDALVYTPNNIDDILDFPLVGGGGTSFECIWEKMKETERVPNRLIVMTDGFPFGGWGDPNYCDTIFLIHGNPNIRSPHGITVYYEEETKDN